MKKVLAILSVMAFSLTAVMAMDGDTYRAEREQVEGMANSSYILQQNGSDTQIVETSSTTEQTTKKKKRRFFNTDTNSYYHFGAYPGYKGSNGH